MLRDQRRHESFAALDHQQELNAFFVHQKNVAAAEVAAVDNNADGTVAVRRELLNQVLKLADIRDRAGIGLIEKRHLIGFVVSDGNIDDWQPLIHLGVSELDEIQIPRLRVLVCGVVGDVDALTMILPCVPIVQEARNLIALGSARPCCRCKWTCLA